MWALKQSVFVLGMTVSALCASDELYRVAATELQGFTLFDQEISESAVVTLKPKLSLDATGDTDVLNQCLWSVSISISEGAAAYVPGKMVCVGPQKEVLEMTPVGTISAFGQCQSDSCDSFVIEGDAEVVMALEGDLVFTLQPRNERK